LGDRRIVGGGIRRLGDLLSRWEPQIRADLASEYAADLSQLVEDSRYRHLLVLIDQLPATARVRAAMLDDDDYVAGLPDPASGDTPSRPAIYGWTQETELLASLLDTMRSLQQVVVRAFGGQGRRPDPIPRPETAWDRRRNATPQASQDLVDMFTRETGDGVP